MKWMILADSSCELRELKGCGKDVGFATVPMKIRVGEREFVDNAALDTAQMLEAMRNWNGPSTTACPSPEEWAEKFLQADQAIAVTISSNLSGSYNSAMAAREMVLEAHPEKKIHVVDSLSTGGEMAMILWKIRDMIAAGTSFEEVRAAAENEPERLRILFGLASFDNLVKNGRVSRIVGFLAGRLNMRVVGAGSEEGTIEMLHKTRGENRMLALILEEMNKRGYTGETPAFISHCQNENGARLLRNGIRAKWSAAEVTIAPTSGLTSFYAEEQGLIVSF